MDEMLGLPPLFGVSTVVGDVGVVGAVGCRGVVVGCGEVVRGCGEPVAGCGETAEGTSEVLLSLGVVLCLRGDFPDNYYPQYAIKIEINNKQKIYK
jgi:hypothetical protein